MTTKPTTSILVPPDDDDELERRLIDELPPIEGGPQPPPLEPAPEDQPLPATPYEPPAAPPVEAPVAPPTLVAPSAPTPGLAAQLRGMQQAMGHTLALAPQIQPEQTDLSLLGNIGAGLVRGGIQMQGDFGGNLRLLGDQFDLEWLSDLGDFYIDVGALARKAVPEYSGDSAFVRYAGDVAAAAPNLMHQVGAGALLGPLGRVPQIVGFAGTAAAPVVGQQYIEAEQFYRQDGATPEEAQRKAALEAAVAGLITLGTNSIPGGALFGRLPGWRKVLGQTAARHVARVGTRGLIGAGAEALQEMSESLFIDAAAAILRDDPSFFQELQKFDYWKQLGYEGLIALPLGGAAGVVTGAAESVQEERKETARQVIREAIGKAAPELTAKEVERHARPVEVELGLKRPTRQERRVRRKAAAVRRHEAEEAVAAAKEQPAAQEQPAPPPPEEDTRESAEARLRHQVRHGLGEDLVQEAKIVQAAREEHRLAAKVAKSLGIDLIFFEGARGTEGRQITGWIDPINHRRIALNTSLRGDRAVASVMAHELVHTLEGTEAYRAFISFLAKHHGEALYEAGRRYHADFGIVEPFSQWFQGEGLFEAVARFVEDRAFDSGFWTRLAKEDRTLFDKIADIIRRIVAMVRGDRVLNKIEDLINEAAQHQEPGPQRVQASPRLKDMATVATNMKDADFWIIRRGSRKKVGKPTRDFNPEAYGVKVTATNQLDANYLFYAMEYLHSQGYFESRATGTTNLVNIRIDDIRDIQFGTPSYAVRRRAPTDRFAVRPRTLGPLWHSALMRTVEQRKDNERITTAQFMGWLRRQPGVKPAEIQWSGLEDYLATGEKWTIGEIRNYLRAAEVFVEDVVLRERGDETHRRDVLELHLATNQTGETLNALVDRHNIPQVVSANLRLEDSAAVRTGEYVAGGRAGYPETRKIPEEVLEAAKAFREAMRKYNEATSRATGRVQYPEWVLPGGENYREVLLTYPTRDMAVGEGIGIDRPRVVAIYTGGHFSGFNNVLAHVRITDREDANGRRILFIEELQSDWSRAGRRRLRAAGDEPIGFMDADRKAAIEGEKNTLIARTNELEDKIGAKNQALVTKYWEKIMRMRAQQFVLPGRPDPPASQTVGESYVRAYFEDIRQDGLFDPQHRAKLAAQILHNEAKLGEQGEGLYPPYQDGRARTVVEEMFMWMHEQSAAEQEWTDANNRLSVIEGALRTAPPAGPFVAQYDDAAKEWKASHEWVALVLKRMIRMAAEEGYDGIAWINGEETNKRYDLRRRVERVEGYKFDDGTYKVVGWLPNGESREMRAETEQHLEDIVGKPLAEKIINQELPIVSYHDADLYFGGEWAFNLYDKQVPNTLKKLLKRWKVEPETTGLNVEQEDETQSEWPHAEHRTTPFGFVPITDPIADTVVPEGMPRFAVRRGERTYSVPDRWGFYSPVIRVTEDQMLAGKLGKVIHKQQFIAWLKKQPNVHEEEIRWMDLEEFFDEKKAAGEPVSAQVLLDYMKDHEVRVEEEPPRWPNDDEDDVPDDEMPYFDQHRPHIRDPEQEDIDEYILNGDWIEEYAERALDSSSDEDIVTVLEHEPGAVLDRGVELVEGELDSGRRRGRPIPDQIFEYAVADEQETREVDLGELVDEVVQELREYAYEALTTFDARREWDSDSYAGEWQIVQEWEDAEFHLFHDGHQIAYRYVQGRPDYEFPTFDYAAERARETTAEEWQEANEANYSDPDFDESPHAGATKDGGDEYGELLLVLPEPLAEGTQQVPSHWRNNNIIVWARFKARLSEGGRRTLYIEEIQSDWHQGAARSGFRARRKDLERAKSAYVAWRREQIIQTPEGKRPVGAVAATREFVSNTSSSRSSVDAAYERWVTATEEGKEFAKRHGGGATGYPPAPWTQIRWAQLITKRMLRYAADHGYESLSWTTAAKSLGARKLSGPLYDIAAVKAANKVAKQFGAEPVRKTNVALDNEIVVYQHEIGERPTLDQLETMSRSLNEQQAATITTIQTPTRETIRYDSRAAHVVRRSLNHFLASLAAVRRQFPRELAAEYAENFDQYAAMAGAAHGVSPFFAGLLGGRFTTTPDYESEAWELVIPDAMRARMKEEGLSRFAVGRSEPQPEQVLLKGSARTVMFAKTAAGRMPAKMFLDDLDEKQRNSIMRVVERLANGQPTPRGSFKKEKNVRIGNQTYPIHGLKAGVDQHRNQIRVALVGYGRNWMLTHAFIKKQDEWGTRELERAARIAAEQRAQFNVRRRRPMAEGMPYHDELSPGSRAFLKTVGLAELHRLDQLSYPQEAMFAGERVTVLGPVDRFEPYKSQAHHWPGSVASGGQMMVRRPDGQRFVTLAHMLDKPGGGRFSFGPVTRVPERVRQRDRDFFTRFSVARDPNQEYIDKAAVKLRIEGKEVIFTGLYHFAAYEEAYVRITKADRQTPTFQMDFYAWVDEHLNVEDINPEDEGFITSKGRFVTREVAAEIAYRNGQTKLHAGRLLSEELGDEGLGEPPGKFAVRIESPDDILRLLAAQSVTPEASVPSLRVAYSPKDETMFVVSDPSDDPEHVQIVIEVDQVDGRARVVELVNEESSEFIYVWPKGDRLGDTPYPIGMTFDGETVPTLFDKWPRLADWMHADGVIKSSRPHRMQRFAVRRRAINDEADLKSVLENFETGVEGRPELAGISDDERVRRLTDAVDEARKKGGIPERQPNEVPRVEAELLLRDDYEATKKRLIEKIDQGEALTTVETLAARFVAERMSQEAIAKGDEDSWMRAVQMMERYREARTEAGRVLQVARDPYMTLHERIAQDFTNAITKPPVEVERALRKQRGKLATEPNEDKRAAIQQQLDALMKAEGKRVKKIAADVTAIIGPQPLKEAVKDPATAARVARAIQARKSSLADKVFEVYISGILSAPTTHMANFTGNTLNFFNEVVLTRTMTAFVSDVVRVTTLGGLKLKDAPSLGEVWPMWAHGFFPGLLQGFVNFLEAYRTQAPVFVRKIQAQVPGRESKLEDVGARAAIGGPFGSVVRFLGPTTLQAFDEFAKTLVTTMEANALAHRKARRAGFRGKEKRAARKAFMQDMTDPLWQEAYEEARRVVFQDRPGAAAQMALNLRRYPGIRYLIPFVATPERIFAAGLSKTPLMTLPLIYRTLKTAKVQIKGVETAPGQITYQENAGQLMRDVTNTLIGFGALFFIKAFMEGAFEDKEDRERRKGWPRVTGSSARGYDERVQQFRTAPPMSILIGDQYVSYRRLEPFAVQLATIIDMVEAIESAEDGDAAEAVFDAMDGVLDQLTDKTFLKTLGEIIEIVRTPHDAVRMAKGARVIHGLTTAWTPNVIKSYLRAEDPYLRDSRISRQDSGWWEPFKQALPYGFWPSKRGSPPPPRYDVWGREIVKGTPFRDENRFGATLYRWFLPAQVKSLDEIHRLDYLVRNWNQKVEAGTAPAPRGEVAELLLPKPPAAWVRRDNKTVYLTKEEYHEFTRDAGRKAAERLMRYNLNFDDPTFRDYQTVKRVLAEAHGDWRDNLVRKRKAAGNWP